MYLPHVYVEITFVIDRQFVFKIARSSWIVAAIPESNQSQALHLAVITYLDCAWEIRGAPTSYKRPPSLR